jgi:hypothetical protein
LQDRAKQNNAQEPVQPLILAFKHGTEPEQIAAITKRLPQEYRANWTDAVVIWIGDEKVLENIQARTQAQTSLRFFSDEPGRWNLPFDQWQHIQVEIIIDALHSIPMQKIQSLQKALDDLKLIQVQA